MATSLALRGAAVGATSTSISTVLNRFLKSTSTVFTPFAANRSVATTTTSDNDEDKGPVVVHGPPQKFKMENPFQLDGPSNVIEVDEVKHGTLVRVTLPGVGPDGIKVWAENNTVFFAGKGEIEFEGEQSGRKYGGSLEFQPELNIADGVKADIVNGVLSLLVPNAEGGEKKKDGL